MKLIKYNFQTAISGIFSFLLTLLGFSSCNSDDPAENIRMEYGVPSASFRVLGKVVSAETKAPVQNIRVTLLEYNTWKDGAGFYYESKGDSLVTQTRTDGSFTFVYGGFPSSKKYIYLLEDVDGDANGRFVYKKDSILFMNPKFKNGDEHWYSGEAEEDFGTIEVTPEK